MAGRPWVIANDEQNPANDGLVTDEEDYWHDGIRKQTLWGNLMAGGGAEYYFGHMHPHSDLTCQDFRSRNHLWDMSPYALEFFHKYLPFWEMSTDNRKVSTEGNFCFCNPPEVYAVYLKSGSTPKSHLSGAVGIFDVKWYDPRTAGPLHTRLGVASRSGTMQAISGGAVCSLGNTGAGKPAEPSICYQSEPARSISPAGNCLAFRG